MLSASPATGSADGGTRLAVFGSNLVSRYSSNRIVRFGDVAVVGHFVSSALVVVETPAVDYFGPTRLGDGSGVSNFVFSYVESARVDSVSPSVAPLGRDGAGDQGFIRQRRFLLQGGHDRSHPRVLRGRGHRRVRRPARDEGAAVVTVASDSGMSTGPARYRSRTSFRGSRRLTRTSRRSRRWRRWFPLPARSAVDPRCTASARSSRAASSFIEFGGAMALARRILRRRHRRGAPVRSSGRWLCTDPRVSAACSRTWRMSMKVPSPSPPSSEPTAARRSPSSAPRSARVEPRGRLAESARSVPSRRRTREATGSSAGRPRRSSERAPSRLEHTTGPRGRRAARCSRRTRRAAFSRRHPRLPREPTSQTPRFPSSACGFTYERMRGRRLGFPLSTAVPTRVSWLFESTIHQLRRRLSTTRAAACTPPPRASPPRRAGAARRAASRADP